jgi:hypothetical protein
LAFFLVFISFTFILIEFLHGVSDSAFFLIIITFSFSISIGISGNSALCFGVSVHEQINHDFPVFFTGDIATELEDFASKEPEAVSNGVLGLVVGGNGNINPVGGRVSVAKSDHGDVHVGGLLDGLMVKTGVANNDEAGLHELLGVVIGKGTGNPLSTEVLGTSVGSELEDSTLGEGALGNDQDILLVLDGGGSDDTGSNHKLLPRLGKVKVVNTFLVALVDVGLHLFGAVAGPYVHLSGDHMNEIVLAVLIVKYSLSFHCAMCFLV